MMITIQPLAFMTYDHDGKVRMDCSSEYAMADVIKQIGNYDLAVGNDPDYDRMVSLPQRALPLQMHSLRLLQIICLRPVVGQIKGVGETVVCTTMIDKWAAVKEIPVYGSGRL